MSPTREQFQALFEPRGVIVAGASTHPGKFGFVALHNILAAGYPGKVFATNREGAEVLGDRRRRRSIDDLPDGEADLVFVCTPAAANLDLLRACRQQGRPGRVRRLGRLRRGRGGGPSGRGRAGRAGRRARDPAGRAERPGRHLARRRRCAPRSWRPYPPAGRIGVASQSGNFVSSFMNYAGHSGHRHQPGRQRRQLRGGRRARLPRLLRRRPGDRGRARPTSRASSTAGPSSTGMAGVAARKPLVLVKGGATVGRRPGGGQPHRVAGRPTTTCSTAPAARPASPGPPRSRRRYEAAATFATQPLPAGPRDGRLHDRRRLGRGHRRRHRPHRPRAAAAARRPPGRDRQEAAAPLEPQQPDRPGRQRDPRHDPRGAGDRGRAPRRRRGDLPRPRHPGQPGRWSGRAPSTRTTASSASSTTTSARTPGSPRPPPTSRPTRASRSSPPPSWRSPTRPTPARRRSGPAASSATPRPTGPSPRSPTCGTTPATASAGTADDRGDLTLRRLRRLVLPLLLVVAVVACAVAAVRLDQEAAETPAGGDLDGAGHPGALGPAGARPLSPRPSPTPASAAASTGIVGAAAVDELPRRRRRTAARSSPTSPTQSLIPASTEKVLTAAAALEVLGPDTRFRTTVEAARPAERRGRGRRPLARRRRRPGAHHRQLRRHRPTTRTEAHTRLEDAGRRASPTPG